MLMEMWDYWTSGSAPWARREGYLYDSIALAHRARRCEQYWGDHLAHCHNLMNRFCRQYSGAKSVAILGSGLLLETPLHLLPAGIERIVLVDAVHTKDVRKRVSTRYADRIKRIEWREMNLNTSEVSTHCDLVISANLLSQLPQMPVRRMRRRDQTDEKITQVQKRLQEIHMLSLPRWADHVLLFSDYSMLTVSRQGETLAQVPTVVPLIKWQQHWRWNLAPAPEVSKDHSIVLEMGAIEF